MNFEVFNISFLNWAASAVLLAGVVDDFLTRKVHNWLVLTAFGLALIACALLSPELFWQKHLLGFFAALGLSLPLVLIGWLGAGDMKLLTVFGLLAGGHITFQVLAFSFVWAAIWGLTLVCINGSLKTYLANLKNILLFTNDRGLKLQAMPFTVPIFFGWMTYLKLESLHLQIF